MRNKKLQLFAIIFTIFCISGCSDDDVKSKALTCNPGEPFQEFSWLQDLKDSMESCSCEQSIIKGVYMGNTVYFLIMTDELCNWEFRTDLYNCHGQIIKEYRYVEGNQNTFEKFQMEVTGQEVIYVCKE